MNYRTIIQVAARWTNARKHRGGSRGGRRAMRLLPSRTVGMGDLRTSPAQPVLRLGKWSRDASIPELCSEEIRRSKRWGSVRAGARGVHAGGVRREAGGGEPAGGLGQVATALPGRVWLGGVSPVRCQWAAVRSMRISRAAPCLARASPCLVRASPCLARASPCLRWPSMSASRARPCWSRRAIASAWR